MMMAKTRVTRTFLVEGEANVVIGMTHLASVQKNNYIVVLLVLSSLLLLLARPFFHLE